MHLHIIAFLSSWPLNNTGVKGTDLPHSWKSMYNYSPHMWIANYIADPWTSKEGLNYVGQMNCSQLKKILVWVDPKFKYMFKVNYIHILYMFHIYGST